jgi:diadenosine tetraphosphate (Ap4A) HIT family hydrolase
MPHPSPISTFHLLVVPRRHVSAFYDLDVGEQRHIWEVLRILRDRIAGTLPVQRFDVGFEDGDGRDADAHAVVHLLPRIGGSRMALPSNIEWVNLE